MRRRRFLTALALSAFIAAPAWAEGKKKGGGVSYVQLPTLTAQTFHPDGRHAVFTVEAGLDVADAGLRHKVILLTPRLRDAYTSALALFATNMRPGEPPDLERLSAKLQAETDRVVGQPGARLLLGTTLVN